MHNITDCVQATAPLSQSITDAFMPTYKSYISMHKHWHTGTYVGSDTLVGVERVLTCEEVREGSYP